MPKILMKLLTLTLSQQQWQSLVDAALDHAMELERALKNEVDVVVRARIRSKVAQLRSDANYILIRMVDLV